MKTKTNQDQRRLWRLAERLRQSFRGFQGAGKSNLSRELENLTDRLDQLNVFRHRLDLCKTFNLPAAAREVQAELRNYIDNLGYDLAQAKQAVPAEPSDKPDITLRDLVQDLGQLQQEFGSWNWDAPEGILSVTTESIVLDSLNLGTFELRLNVSRLGSIDSSQRRLPLYTVVAQEPNNPATSDNVTHPHVSDDVLCEGDGAAGIKQALEEGRVCDFFLLLRSILNTYNPDSAYVKIEHWEGQACYDCGRRMSGDDSAYCESCDHDFCFDCVGSCHSCDTTTCQGCLSQCPGCEEYSCPDCIKKCAGCGQKCCKNCLDDDGFCKDCQEPPDQPPEHTPEQTSETPSIEGSDHDHTESETVTAFVTDSDDLGTQANETDVAADNNSAHEVEQSSCGCGGSCENCTCGNHPAESAPTAALSS